MQVNRVLNLIIMYTSKQELQWRELRKRKDRWAAALMSFRKMIYSVVKAGRRQRAGQSLAFEKLLEKTGMMSEDIRYIYAGDLLGQLIATSFGLKTYDVPLFGLYGACSTMGESLSLAAMCVNAGFADNVAAIASRHFASAEKQFRFPLLYGNQRPMSSTWTVTGAGAYLVSNSPVITKCDGDVCRIVDNGYANVIISGITTGKIVDYGVKDSMNMGACMAPAAADLIEANYKDFEVTKGYYDMIITGDLGYTGKEILLTLLKEKGIDISDIYTDCGIEVFDKNEQDTQSGEVVVGAVRWFLILLYWTS